jgi:hypothetical protein
VLAGEHVYFEAINAIIERISKRKAGHSTLRNLPFHEVYSSS